MGLLSIFQRKSDGAAKPAAVDASADSVQQMRTRARRRFIGAVVLVMAGVIGFPLLFETQPRPIPVDIPIEIPRKENATPLVMPPARPAASAAAANRAGSAPVMPEVITETAAEAGRELPGAAEKPASVPANVRPAAKPPVAVAKPPVVAPSPAETPRAQAALPDGKSPAKEAAQKDDARYVVQVGAFSDAAAAREVRLKAEKLGLKTYTQIAETPSGSRIRVRAGPYPSRGEADKALAKAKAGGLSAVVLTL